MREEPILNDKPRLMIIVNSLGSGGAERHAVTLANLLSDNLYIVLVYLKPEEHIRDLVRDERLVAVHSLRVRAKLETSSIKKLAQLAEQHRIDLVICSNTFSLLYGQVTRLVCSRKFKVLCVFHTTKLSRWKEQLAMMIYRPLFWTTHCLVYICNAQSSYWLRRGLWSRRMEIIHNGVDINHFRPIELSIKSDVQPRALGFPPGTFVVGICAGLRQEKAHIDLLRAVKRLDGEGLRWSVLIIGEGPMRSSIENEIRNLGLENRVKITGYQIDVRSFMGACDVLAIVSTAIETFSLAALEAMAMGKPMIMSLVGGSSEMIDDGVNGYLFPASHVPALSECLKRCSDRQRLSEMSVAARARVVADFSEISMVGRYRDLIMSIHQGVQPSATVSQ